MDKNLTNKDIKDMIIFDNYPKSTFKDYLEVLFKGWSIGSYRWWWGQVWRKRMCKGTTSGFYRIRRYKIEYGVFFSMYTS